METMHTYYLILRPGVVPDAESLPIGGDAGAVLDVTARRVEGWAKDYAFFGDLNDPRAVTSLIPRDVVLRLWRCTTPIESEGERHPLADAEEQAYEWFNGLSGEKRFSLLPPGPGTADPQKWWEGMSAGERILTHQFHAARALPENHDV